MKNNMEKGFRVLFIWILWYAIITFISNQPNPMLWGAFTKIIAIFLGIIIVNKHLKE